MIPKVIIEKFSAPLSGAGSLPAGRHGASGGNKEEVELVALEFPEFHLGSVGAYYENFPQIEDKEVIKILSAKGGSASGGK